ncbi:MAG: hypothetical protein AAFS10_18505 [Myxococcota bacterium]
MMTVDVDQIPAPTPTFGQRLYGRSVYLVVGPVGGKGRRIEGLRISWSIKKGKQKKPDPATIQVWNMSEDTRSWIFQNGGQVFVYAGYGEQPGQLFQGDIDRATALRNGTDWVLEIEARDGGGKYAGGQMGESYATATDSNKVLSRMAAAMGLSGLQKPSDLDVVSFARGWSHFGPGRDALDKLVRQLGAEWSIQDDQIVITRAGGPSGEPVVYLDTGEDGGINTGLLRVDNAKDDRNELLKCLALTNGDIKPKGRVYLTSRRYTGLVQVVTVEHKGDSGWDTNYYTEFEAKAI